MRNLLIVMLLSVLLTGSIFQSYEQTVSINGNSVIEKEMSLDLFSGILGENADMKIEIACMNPSLGCVMADGNLTITDEFTENDGYYSFSVDYGIPYTEYQITIKKIPVERFTEKFDDILVGAEITDSPSENYGQPINLQDSESTKEIAGVIKSSNLDISYAVIMPGETISESEFLLSEVLEDSEPIVVKSRELNWGYLVFIVAVIILAAFALSFRKSKRKG